MAKFEMYQQFENRKSGRIAHVARIDEVCKTIILMYDEAREGDKENGVTLSYPSVSKNWKRLDTYAHPDLSASEVKKADKTTEDTASDGTSYSEVMQEIVEDEKKAVKKASDKKKAEKKSEKTSEVQEKKVKKEKKIKSDVDTIAIAIQALDGYNYTYNGGKYVNVKDSNNKTLLNIYRRSNAIRVYVSSDTFKRLEKHSNMYEIKGPGAGKLDMSIYINTADIASALNILLKED